MPTKLPLYKHGGYWSVPLEEELAENERERAWEHLYSAVHWGAENARPIEADQRMLIMVVAALLRRQDELAAALAEAAQRFDWLAAHDDAMRNGVVPSVGASEARRVAQTQKSPPPAPGEKPAAG